jgi:hypothetical protein
LAQYAWIKKAQQGNVSCVNDEDLIFPRQQYEYKEHDGKYNKTDGRNNNNNKLAKCNDTNMDYCTLINNTLDTASVVWWSEFLAANPEVPGSIPCATRFSE